MGLRRIFLPSAVALFLFAGARPASAQSLHVRHSKALQLNVGPMMGIVGGGLYARIHPELQLHKGDNYEGHSLGLGVDIVFWPNEAGPSFAFAARYQFDQQLVSGAQFFVSPYVGLEAGIGVFDVFNGAEQARLAFVATPVVGVDFKVVVGQSLILGFRPVGFMVPVFIAETGVTADAHYDIGFTVGSTL